jgi:hypothetical protein
VANAASRTRLWRDIGLRRQRDTGPHAYESGQGIAYAVLNFALCRNSKVFAV